LKEAVEEEEKGRMLEVSVSRHVSFVLLRGKYFCGIHWMGDSMTTELFRMDMFAEATKYTVIYWRVRKIEKSDY
jgi:hypothetical protein